MAEQDDAQKTEEPSQKKLDDAAKKGDVARSQELRSWFMLVAATVVVMAMVPYVAQGLQQNLGRYFANLHQVPMDGQSLLVVMGDLIRQVAILLSGPIILLVVAGIGASMIQHKITFSGEKLKVKIEKISVLKGLKRMFSSQSLMEFVKTLLKFALITAVTMFVIWPESGMLYSIITTQPSEIPAVAWVLVLKLMGGVVAAMTVIAAVDFMYQKMQHTKKMRMTKQEVKDEYKQLEGDPHIKARIKQIRTERARTRMMAAVPEAAVVITNPTHYAVALKYAHGDMEVPVVVAKGVDLIAAKIREVAEEHEIPFVENPPLARALYATVEIDEEIPSDHYKAVAEVISYVLRLKRRRPKGTRVGA